MNEYISLTDEQKRDYAEACAEAYVNQYIEGRRVMTQPIVVFDRASGEFSWQSSLTPLGNGEIAVTEIEPDIYGEVGDNPEVARDAITGFIVMEYGDLEWNDIEAKINSDEDF